MAKHRSLKKIITISVLIIAFFAYQDVTGFHLFGLIGGFGGDAYLKVEPLYMKQFWSFSYMMLALMGLIYYVLVKDKSESLSIFIIPSILLLAGLEDLLYFLFLWLPLPSSMPWLYDNVNIMSLTAKAMGLSTVTPLSLIISLVIGIILSIFSYKILIKLN